MVIPFLDLIRLKITIYAKIRLYNKCETYVIWWIWGIVCVIADHIA